MSNPTTILLLLKRVDCVDGVASYLESLVNGLRSVGDRVVIVSGEVTTPDGSEVRQRSIAAAVQEWIVLDGLRPSRPKLAHIRAILAAIKRHGVESVSPQGFASLPLGALVARLARLPVVTNYHPSLHGNQLAAMTGQRPRSQILAYRALDALFRPERYIALSHEIALLFQNEIRIAPARIHEQVLGVETDFYRAPTEAERQAARARFGLGESTIAAVLPGRLNLSKGHDLVAAAVRQLRREQPGLDIVCLFPGGGDQRRTIEANILPDRTDAALFRFLGFVERDVLRDAYWASDIVLLPSRMEGFGLVVAEAMCCGTIAIRTPSGGWQDQVIEGQTGYIVPFNDAAALAAAIAKVAASPDREAMRQAAMRHASGKFAMSRMISGTSSLYRSLAASRSLRDGAVSSRFAR